MTTKTRKPTHPGAYIADIFDNLKENGGMSRNQIAKHLGISPSTLCNIIAEKTRVNADMAVVFEKALGVKADTWLRLQMSYDLWEANKKKKSFLAKVKSLINNPAIKIA
ncbi:putative HTH-type transcriptional regulator YbaQ (plasmid) [Piscirickettsia salmonis]|nr:HigA family addiction module antitoxin [Piscirickettsia salmonis]AMA43909.1 hypothetical protein AWJ11_16090 [Piscirickettsia salmonis]AOS37127.1 hypothetical protein AVM72_17420 [Piscirickettsia salmonis]APS62074.1 hypothetical protein AVI53_16025 [Piscirickettsia salmonis]APS65324.1 hypothetical protein AVI54_16020 [Piscirickettsia salmonis]APS68681.1 hypothetical protein AVI55_16610 [Piscirickettsia salmonis]